MPLPQVGRYEQWQTLTSGWWTIHPATLRGCRAADPQQVVIIIKLQVFCNSHRKECCSIMNNGPDIQKQNKPVTGALCKDKYDDSVC